MSTDLSTNLKSAANFFLAQPLTMSPPPCSCFEDGVQRVRSSICLSGSKLNAGKVQQTTQILSRGKLVCTVHWMAQINILRTLTYLFKYLYMGPTVSTYNRDLIVKDFEHVSGNSLTGPSCVCHLMGVSLSRNLSVLECNIPHLKDKFLPALKTIMICVEAVALQILISSNLYANFEMSHA